jgi:hypothetical protein
MARKKNTDPGAGDAPGTFRGTFEPPGMGIADAPVKIAGPGRCTVSEDGFEVTAFAPASKAPAALVFVLAMIVAVALVMTFADSDFRRWGKIAGFGVLPFALPLIRGSGKYREDRPVTIVVPRDKAEVLPEKNHGLVLIRIRKMKPSGMIHFRPEAGVATFMSAVRR